jgi:hypothetical protein
MKTFIAVSAIALLAACNSGGEKSTTPVAEVKVDTTPVAPVAPAAATPTVKEVKTKTGKVILIEESHPTGASLSDVKVSFAGDAASAQTLKDVDPVFKVMNDDLDADGFDEVYIVTQSAGSGSAGTLYGFASLKDKSLNPITVPEVTEKDLAKGGQFEGYEGHDEFELIENSVARRFPIKGDKVTQRAINYKLKAGEAGYKLWIKTSTAY